MYFNSYVFILAFLPITLIGYFLVNRTKRYQLGQIWLLLASLVFIGYLNIQYVIITMVSALIGYGFIMAVASLQTTIEHRSSNNRLSEKQVEHKKLICGLGVFTHIAILLYFKYTNFFLENINQLLGAELPLLKILLPIGISFYTFQQIAYLVDCYRDPLIKCDFLEYCLYIMYFPKFLQGPILLHEDMIPALRDDSNKKFSIEYFSKGLYIFSLGLGKKVLLADSLALLVDAGYSNIADLNSPSAMLAMVAYSLQLYFDFSGYCDMAMGVGQMLRIPVPLNFDSPYKATKVTDIWARWHMTLTRFFTRYVYIPLGGNRKGSARMYVNTFLVFLVSGLWHGAAWTFVIWGIMHGIAMVISKALARCRVVFPKVIGWFFTFTFWVFSFAIFRASSLQEALQLFERLLNGEMGRLYDGFYEAIEKNIEITLIQRIDITNILGNYPNILVISLVLLPLLGCLCMKNSWEKVETFTFTAKKLFVTVVLFFYAMISLGSVTVFLYANF